MANKTKLARRHTIASYLGLLAFGAWIAAHYFGAPASFGYVGIIVLLVAIIVMFATRNADEYVSSLWSTGANTAFLAIVAYLLFGPVIEGFYEGFTRTENGQSLPPDAGAFVVLVAFFAGDFWKRLRGGY